MKHLLIIKCGSTFPDLLKYKGDFERWIINGLPENNASVTIANPVLDKELPNPRHFSGIILTGSHNMVTEKLPWIEKTTAWLISAKALNVPVLGICFGHQLLAAAFGGTVNYNPQGPEFGTVDIYLTESASQDPLFNNMLSPFKAQVSHSQSVITLPPDAIHLAYNNHDANQAFFCPPCYWGVQFHPEFDKEIVMFYTNHYFTMHPSADKQPGDIIQNIQPAPHSIEILKRFARFTQKYKST